jgi:hypothetical protein
MHIHTHYAPTPRREKLEQRVTIGGSRWVYTKRFILAQEALGDGVEADKLNLILDGRRRLTEHLFEGMELLLV